MSIRFSTEAANADILGEDTPAAGGSDGGSQEVGADGTLGDRGSRPPQQGGKAGQANADEARPGKDINAPGFVKDPDAGKPS